MEGDGDGIEGASDGTDGTGDGGCGRASGPRSQAHPRIRHATAELGGRARPARVTGDDPAAREWRGRATVGRGVRLVGGRGGWEGLAVEAGDEAAADEACQGLWHCWWWRAVAVMLVFVVWKLLSTC